MYFSYPRGESYIVYKSHNVRGTQVQHRQKSLKIIQSSLKTLSLSWQSRGIIYLPDLLRR